MDRKSGEKKCCIISELRIAKVVQDRRRGIGGFGQKSIGVCAAPGAACRWLKLASEAISRVFEFLIK